MKPKPSYKHKVVHQALSVCNDIRLGLADVLSCDMPQTILVKSR